MKFEDVKRAFESISKLIEEEKDYLGELDSQNGDGDLGISMSNGYRAVVKYLESAAERDLGRIFLNCGKTFNEAAPSSLGTILSVGMIGMAKALKGREECTIKELALAMDTGLHAIMERAASKPGEKTVLDALFPAVESLKKATDGNRSIFETAAKAAAKGSERTKNMCSVHGRAAYYGDKTIGMLDGGSVVGKLIFEGICQSVK